MIYRYFIWDYDGTLFDTYPAIVSAYREVLKKEYGVASDYDEIYAWAKVTLNHCNEKIAEKYGIDPDEFRSRYGRKYSECRAGEDPPFAGAKEICGLIKSAGGRNYIITHRDEQSLFMSLEKHDMKDLFEDFITRDHMFPRKPDPKDFLFLIDKHRLDPARTLGIGDRDIDILAARSAGIGMVYII